MNRELKRNRLVSSAGQLAFDLQHGADAFFGNQGVSLYANGQTGDIIGHMLKKADILPPVAFDVTDPKEAIAIALGLNVRELPQNLQEAINTLAIAGDDTKRSYSRRVPKLVKLLNTFVTALYEARLGSGAPAPVQRNPKFVLPGKSI